MKDIDKVLAEAVANADRNEWIDAMRACVRDWYEPPLVMEVEGPSSIMCEIFQLAHEDWPLSHNMSWVLRTLARKYFKRGMPDNLYAKMIEAIKGQEVPETREEQLGRLRCPEDEDTKKKLIRALCVYRLRNISRWVLDDFLSELLARVADRIETRAGICCPDLMLDLAHARDFFVAEMLFEDMEDGHFHDGADQCWGVVKTAELLLLGDGPAKDEADAE